MAHPMTTIEFDLLVVREYALNFGISAVAVLYFAGLFVWSGRPQWRWASIASYCLLLLHFFFLGALYDEGKGFAYWPMQVAAAPWWLWIAQLLGHALDGMWSPLRLLSLAIFCGSLNSALIYLVASGARAVRLRVISAK